jgi:hypothetical protein
VPFSARSKLAIGACFPVWSSPNAFAAERF